MLDRPDIALVVLLGATLCTWLIGETGAAGAVSMLAILLIGAIKARLVIIDFMGLRGVKFFWRAVLLGWLIVVLGLIALAYWLGT